MTVIRHGLYSRILKKQGLRLYFTRHTATLTPHITHIVIGAKTQEIGRAELRMPILCGEEKVRNSASTSDTNAANPLWSVTGGGSSP